MNEEWMTIPETARHLGISEKSVRRWVDAGKINAVRVGPRMIRVEVASLDSLVTRVEQGKWTA